MDTRAASPIKSGSTTHSEIPTFKTLDLITPDNFMRRINEAEALLSLEKHQLELILDAESSLLHLESEIEKIINPNIDTLNQLIIEFTAIDSDDEHVSIFMARKRAELTKKLEKVRSRLLEKKDEEIENQKKEIEKSRVQLLQKEINAGNYQLELEVFKNNVIVALQSAAAFLFNTNRIKNTAIFNNIFRGISHINHDNTLSHSLHPEHFTQNDLISLQQAVNGILRECQDQRETEIVREIKRHLNSLNHTNHIATSGLNIVIHDDHVKFSEALYQLEMKSNAAKAQALTNYNDFVNEQRHKLDGFNGYAFNLCDPLRTEIFAAEEKVEEMKRAVHSNNLARITELEGEKEDDDEPLLIKPSITPPRPAPQIRHERRT